LNSLQSNIQDNIILNVNVFNTDANGNILNQLTHVNQNMSGYTHSFNNQVLNINITNSSASASTL